MIIESFTRLPTGHFIGVADLENDKKELGLQVERERERERKCERAYICGCNIDINLILGTA